MSKILKALEKAKTLKEHNNAIAFESNEALYNGNGVTDDIKTRFEWGHIIVLAFLIAIGITSAFVNLKVVSELNKAKGMTLSLSSVIENHQQHIKSLESSIAEIKFESLAQIEDLSGELSEKERALNDMEIDYNLLRVKISDLNTTNKKLLKNYIVFEEEIEQLKKLNTELKRNYSTLGVEIRKLKKMQL